MKATGGPRPRCPVINTVEITKLSGPFTTYV